MPISASSTQIINLTSASHLDGDHREILFNGLEFDSREIKGGELFVALAGEKTHGNSFIQTAIDKGAALILTDLKAELPAVSNPEKILVAEDSLKAFWKIAGWWRAELSLPVMAITGSVGKTTCKEIAASILKETGKGCYSLKSHNNHVGVPYTICRSSRDDKWMILEVGMNNRGEIAPLSEMAQPDQAVISTIAPAHIGNLGSLENIIEEKLDIISGLKPGGSVLVGLDQDLLIEHAHHRNCRIEFFGNYDGSKGNLSEVKSEGLEGIRFNLLIDGSWKEVGMKILGRKNAQNAACSARACKLLMPDLTAGQIIKGLEDFRAPQMRLNLKRLADGSQVIDDSYNANPASMKAGIELLFDIGSGKSAVVLGDMLELGSFSETYHKEISDQLAAGEPAFVVAVGNYARHYLDSLPVDPQKYRFFEKAEDAYEFLGKQSFDLLLVKGSRGIGLDKVVNFLVG